LPVCQLKTLYFDAIVELLKKVLTESTLIFKIVDHPGTSPGGKLKVDLHIRGSPGSLYTHG
jgi:hypothetical protein